MNHTNDFSQCKLLPVLSNDASSSSCSVVHNEHKKYTTNSFYLDSSGRASISLPLQLQFPSQESFSFYQYCFEIQPIEENNNNAAPDATKTTTTTTTTNTNDRNGTNDKETTTSVSQQQQQPNRRITIEAKVTLSIGSGEAIAATVEKVTLLSATQQQSPPAVSNNTSPIMILETDIIVRVSRAGTGAIVPSSDASGAKADLEIAAVLQEEETSTTLSNTTTTTTGTTTTATKNTINNYQTTMAALASLNLGGAVAQRFHNTATTAASTTTAVRYTRTKPFTLQASLTNALSISVVSVPGPTVGHTLLGLTIQHTGTHTEDICITNIALHPSHSRECHYGHHNNSSLSNIYHHSHNKASTASSGGGGQGAVAAVVVKDTSKLVQWGYAPQTDPDLPLTLHCHEAFSTILAVDATQDSKCRKFRCPVSVTAVLGFQQPVDTGATATNTTTDEHKSSKPQQQQRHRYQVIAVAEAEWETSKPAIEPTDGFRVDLSLGGDGDANNSNNNKSQSCKVGEPLTVQVQVRNLSTQARDVVIFISNNNNNMSKGVDDSDEHTNKVQGGEAPQIYIAEKDGYKLGIKGVDNHTRNATIESTGDGSQDLISVDVAYLLGVLQAQSTAKASLRFIPLREGTVKIPNLDLVDKKTGKRYACLHKLRASVQAA